MFHGSSRSVGERCSGSPDDKLMCQPGIVGRIGWDFRERHMTRGKNEPRELLIGDGVTVDPEAVNRDPV
jgi:hypothetical protein